MNQSDQSLHRFLHAVADPTRRKILAALRERGGCSLDKDTGLCALDIEQRMHLSQPTISHHMAILKKAGLVEAKKEGLWRWYRRNDRAIGEMLIGERTCRRPNGERDDWRFCGVRQAW